jgi:hypothetical protein
MNAELKLKFVFLYSFVLFDDIQDVNNLPQVKSIFARVVVKFPRRHDSQHFILQDITVSYFKL